VRRTSAILLGVIMLVGALLRIWSPGRIGLWGDEVQFLNIAALPDLRTIISFLALHESHPPLFYVIGHLASDLSAAPESMSLLVLAASIAVIPLAAWLASLSGIRGAGLVSLSLVAVSIPLSLVSVQIRPYALVSALVLVSVGAIIRGAPHSRMRWRAIWTVTTLLLLYLHHIAILFVVAEVLVLMALALRHDGRALLLAWAPWIALVLLLAIPDLVLLLRQEHRTGYLPTDPAAFSAPLRQAGWLALCFPGEVLLPLVVSLLSIRSSWRWFRAGGDDPQAGAPHVLNAAFLLVWVLMVLASYRHSVLVDHVVLAFTPLGLCFVAIVVAYQVQSRRRVRGMVAVQGVVACIALSALASVGAVKSNTEELAKLVSAERLPSDFVLLAPRVPGATFNRYLSRPISQIDYPDVGATSLYHFDNGIARLSDPATWDVTLDSLKAVHRAGRRLWFVFPAHWLPESRQDSASARKSTNGLVVARQRTVQLHRVLISQFGDPGRTITAMPSPWSMELMSAELFGTASDSTVENSPSRQRR
jgi:hypothetical protein